MSEHADAADPAKRAAQAAILARREQLIDISTRLHDDPETAWNEIRSAALLTEALAGMGFRVEEGYLGLPTAFRAVAGTGPFRVGLMAEYDALPGLGQACGHNLIAAMSVGAAAALAKLADAAGLTVEVYGTPAEEGGGGKIELLDRGAFAGLDLAMMAHPAPVDVAEAKPLAVAHWRVEYQGRSAHAAAYPTLGINAADAFTLAQVAIGLLRQQLPPTLRVHGIVTDAGTAPNAIPGHTSGRWYVRATTLAELDEFTPRIEDCFRAGAVATGCRLTLTAESKPYAEFRTDRRALDRYVANARALGRRFETEGPATRMATASTDMGNVSQVVRAIHPYIGVGSYPVSNHQKEFADHCVGAEAERALLDGATALAWTALDVAAERDRRQNATDGRTRPTAGR
jgi:amidohydrolase